MLREYAITPATCDSEFSREYAFAGEICEDSNGNLIWTKNLEAILEQTAELPPLETTLYDLLNYHMHQHEQGVMMIVRVQPKKEEPKYLKDNFRVYELWIQREHMIGLMIDIYTDLWQTYH